MTLGDLAERARWPQVAAAMAGWLTARRWFAGKARVVTEVAVHDAAMLRAGGPVVLDLVLAVGYADGGTELYQVPLVDSGTDGTIATIAGIGVRDALADPDGCRVLGMLAASAGTSATTTRGATVTGHPLPGIGDLHAASVRQLTVEQSNSSVVFDDAWILKVFRRLEDGLNPDVEVTRELTAAGNPHVPAHVGALALTSGTHVHALAVLSAFASTADEGWSLACAEAAQIMDGAPPRAGIAARVGDLGRVLAGLHAGLRDAFGPRAGTADDARALADKMRRQARHALDLAAARAPQSAAAVLDRRAEILAACDDVAALGSLGPLVRIHGDLHLGQVLHEQDTGWLVLDWEGEPARPLTERRLPASPLRDVAGMLRSFEYVSAHAAGGAQPPPALAGWRDSLRAGFVDGYLEAARPAGLLPDDDAATATLLAALELDKATYELAYELANRPEWVPIPVEGILRALTGRISP
ncbi:maltokinase [soil metagenome]